MALPTYAYGYTARERGAKAEDNPFPKTGELYMNWVKGWSHADDDLKPKIKVKLTSIKNT